MVKSKLSALVGTLLLVPLLAGCATMTAGLVGAGAGVGTVAYLEGDLEATKAATLDEAWQASNRALDDMGFPVKEKTKQSESARLVARSTDERDVTVELDAVSEEVVEISIRVGTFGDEKLSRQVLDQIEARLN